MNTYEKPLKVLVCGTNFGRVYLKGLERCGNKFKIAGIFSHGSTQSKQEAEKYGVPLITDLNEVSKKDFDMACVVIRSTAVGGKGTEIAGVLLAIEMLLGYTIMSIVKGNDYANFELLCSIICKIIMLALVKIIPLVIDPSIECDMPSKYCFMLTVLPVISTVVVYNIFLITSRIDRLELIAFSTVSSTLILALNLLVYDIYIKLLEQTEIRRENAIYEKQISLFQEQIYVKETAMLNDKMVRDKFYHQLSFIKELVYQRELSQLNEFIDGIMQNKKIEKDGPANSGNVLLDYIVNNKCEIAVKQGIECTVKIEVPYKFPFSDGDIFIILGNALDNAIEGALKCVSRRYIHIKIIYRKENLFIKISNSFDGKVKKDRHGHLISMKSDLTRYGLGLALIEKSVNKYNGLLNFDIDEENFTLTVLLYS